MFRTVPVSIIRRFSLYTQKWYTSYGKLSANLYVLLCVQVKNSWWWAEELSETCRVLFQKYIWEISASGWFYYKNLSRWYTVSWTSNLHFIFLYFPCLSKHRRRQQVAHESLWEIFAELNTSGSPALFFCFPPNFQFLTAFRNVPLHTLRDTHSKFSQREIYNRLESILRKRRDINHPRLLYSWSQLFLRPRLTAHLHNSLFQLHVQTAFVRNVARSLRSDFSEIWNVWTNCRESPKYAILRNFVGRELPDR